MATKTNDIPLSSLIVFGRITEKDFQEFVDVLKKADPSEYQAEGKDGFLDLYKYWSATIEQRGGMGRFTDKLKSNKAKIA